ncbi:hypothetical protein [Legionella micdadei]|uniref:hypothetical protein n=1 Tax=Legionella micdadei TaxID=451 RepID=UPI001C12A370|nr:hypothetical protein [Legionella micdadei]
MISRSLITRRIFWSLLALLITMLAFWLILTYDKGSKPAKNVSPILHIDGRLVIPPESPLRRFIVIKPVVEQLVITPFTLPAIIEADPAKLIKVQPPFPDG